MAKLKLRTQGKHLWVRTIGSTAVGQLVDTVIVMLFVFGGKVNPGTEQVPERATPPVRGPEDGTAADGPRVSLR